MFKLESSPIPTFNGFQVQCFRQGRCNLAERRLEMTTIHFAPHLGKVGAFLPNALVSLTNDMLMEAWIAQGTPQVHLPIPEKELLLLGKIWPIQHQLFAGYDDLWFEDGIIKVAFKRAYMPQVQEKLLVKFTLNQLQVTADQLLQRFALRLKKQPRAIVFRPLHWRTLGQCTREGEIYLNPSLRQWAPEIMEETLAHELVHLEYFNHSNAFWRRLTELLPDWLPRTLVHHLHA